MKKQFLMILALACLSITAFADGGGSVGSNSDLFTQESFIATCPEKFLIYIDRHEGGPGAYCNCPEENIGYIDRAEGGPGFYCSETPIVR